MTFKKFSVMLKYDHKLFKITRNKMFGMNGYHKSAVLKTPIKKVKYDTIHKRIQRTGNFIV